MFSNDVSLKRKQTRFTCFYRAFAQAGESFFPSFFLKYERPIPVKNIPGHSCFRSEISQKIEIGLAEFYSLMNSKWRKLREKDLVFVFFQSLTQLSELEKWKCLWNNHKPQKIFWKWVMNSPSNPILSSERVRAFYTRDRDFENSRPKIKILSWRDNISRSLSLDLDLFGFW